MSLTFHFNLTSEVFGNTLGIMDYSVTINVCIVEVYVEMYNVLSLTLNNNDLVLPIPLSLLQVGVDCFGVENLLNGYEFVVVLKKKEISTYV